MRRLLIALLLLTTRAYAIDGGRFGPVTLVEPKGEVLGFVILYSGKDGWGPVDERIAQSVAAAGALVAEVDTKRYLSHLDQPGEGCVWPVGDAESFSLQVQRMRGTGGYFSPILAGRGAGGTLARVSLDEAPAATIGGAVGLDPAFDAGAHRPPCPPSTQNSIVAGYLSPAPARPGFYETGTAGADPAAAMTALIRPHLNAAAPALPLTEMAVDKPSELMAVVLSGDGGWRDLDKSIAEELVRRGVPVVGWDSLRYFWRERSPEQTARDLDWVITTYSARWQARHVILIGYSFGADVLPFAYNRLSQVARAKVLDLALLGLAERADFEIAVSGWLGKPPGDRARPVGPELDAIAPALVQCFQGKDEDDSACPGQVRRGVEVIVIPGGHHFDGDYAGLAARILDGSRTRAVIHGR